MTADQPAQPRGWFRRNIIGLLTIVPLFLSLWGVAMFDRHYRPWEWRALAPVSEGAKGWVRMDGILIRLVNLRKVTPVNYSGKPVAMASDAQTWRGDLEFKLSDPDAGLGCSVKMEDDQAKIYSANPAELASASGFDTFSSCTDHKKSSQFVSQFYFVMPKGATPAAVRVEWFPQNPRYARMPASNFLK